LILNYYRKHTKIRYTTTNEYYLETHAMYRTIASIPMGLFPAGISFLLDDT